MPTRDLEYQDGAQRCLGHLAVPDGAGRRPGILVVHEAWGLGDHAIERADRLAAMGYVALAADIFGDRHIPADPAEAFRIIGGFRSDPAKLRARAGAAVEALKGQPECDRRIGAIGFCFGGSTVLELARVGWPGIAAVTSFHGALATTSPAEPGAVTARVLVCHGAEDELVPHKELSDFLDDMGRAQADCTTIAYTGARHSFTNRAADGSMMPTIIYHQRTDERSWAVMTALFAEVFA